MSCSEVYLLDTNIVSALRRPERSPAVAAWLRSRPDEELFISVVTLGEIERGIAMQEHRNPGFAKDLRVWLFEIEALFADRIQAFGAAEAREWGRLWARLGHDGADLLIAATAIVGGLTVVTRNTRHFENTGADLLALA